MMKSLTILALSMGAVSISVTAQDLSHRTHEYEDSVYDASRDANADVKALLNRIASNRKLGIIVMGANWCHDSRTLAKWFESERFQNMLNPKYEIVYVDVGVPQTGNGRNINIAKDFGIKKIKGTPTIMIIDHNGLLLNKKNARKWRNADSRKEDDVFHHFANFRG